MTRRVRATHRPRTCGWEVAVEHYLPILCGKPAIVVISRAHRDALAVCREHANDTELYAQVQRHEWQWRVIE